MPGLSIRGGCTPGNSRHGGSGPQWGPSRTDRAGRRDWRLNAAPVRTTSARARRRAGNHKEDRIGQGRENAKNYMSTHPEMMAEVSALVRAAYGIGEDVEIPEETQAELPLEE